MGVGQSGGLGNRGMGSHRQRPRQTDKPKGPGGGILKEVLESHLRLKPRLWHPTSGTAQATLDGYVDHQGADSLHGPWPECVPGLPCPIFLPKASQHQAMVRKRCGSHSGGKGRATSQQCPARVSMGSRQTELDSPLRPHSAQGSTPCHWRL